tara:strand:+ start:6144 stop:6479 length:336 start_codon:yes stop_codon:yes gene_type:complete
MTTVNRYYRRTEIDNNDRFYLKKRNIKNIKHYGSPSLKYPTAEQIKDLDILTVIWKKGDRFYKLADQHYGNPELWWVIAWFNKRPTDAEVEYGNLIQIPFPIEIVLQYYNI